MGAAFDLASSSLRYFERVERVRDLVAKRIIEAAKKGERDPIRLHSRALMGFSIDDVLHRSKAAHRRWQGAATRGRRITANFSMARCANDGRARVSELQP